MEACKASRSNEAQGCQILERMWNQRHLKLKWPDREVAAAI